MLHLHNRKTITEALTMDLEPALKTILSNSIQSLGELVDYTEYVVLQEGDTESDLIDLIGITPTQDPLDNSNYGDADFVAHWDHLNRHGDWFEMIITCGWEFAYILLIKDSAETPANLLALCREYCSGG